MKLVVIWEHEYDNMIRKDPDAKAFVDQLKLVDRLDPRDSLMGGRTNGCTLLTRERQGEPKLNMSIFLHCIRS